MTKPESITATFERAMYRKADNGWGIYRCDVGTCKGVIPWQPEAGQVMTLSGKWQRSDFSGANEFVFSSAYLSLPIDPRALLTYAASITPGIGPAKEREIWEKYGAQWRDADPLDVRGMTDQSRFAWSDTLRRIDEERLQSDCFAYLLGKGCSMNMASAAWEKWKENAVGRVQANCYDLASLPHYGFLSVDAAIRKNFGIEDRDPRRIDAAILYVLGDSPDGSTLMTRDALLAGLAKIVPDAAPLYDSSIHRLLDVESISIISISNECDGFALAEDAKNEGIINDYFAA
jgi:hypothetical protein